MRYHSRVGYTYMPDTKLRVQGANGGYLVRTNSSGFRSDREFLQRRDPEMFRALLFGDSQTAGDGTANKFRYSDLLEAALPGLEVYNYAISGTATDQHYLAYQEHASTEHDLIVIGVYVENIRRITRRVVKARDADGLEVFRAKPYFKPGHDGLVLGNVPVPRDAWTEQTLPKDLLPYVYSYGEANFFFRNPSRRHASIVRALAPFGPIRRIVKRALTRLRKYQPLPDYEAPDTPGWQLMRQILKAWIAESRAPVLLVTLPHDSSLAGVSDPRKYQTRFGELAGETGCRVYDPLPELLKMAPSERRELWSDAYGHLSAKGHEAIARLLAPEIGRFMRERPGNARRESSSLREGHRASARD